MTTAFYQAWAELDQVEEVIGIEPVGLPEQCSALTDKHPYLSPSYSIRKPCAYCQMVKTHGAPPPERRQTRKIGKVKLPPPY